MKTSDINVEIKKQVIQNNFWLGKMIDWKGLSSPIMFDLIQSSDTTPFLIIFFQDPRRGSKKKSTSRLYCIWHSHKKVQL